MCRYVDIRTRGTTSATTTMVPESGDTEVPVTTIRYRSSTTIKDLTTTTPTLDNNNTFDNYTVNGINAQVDVSEEENSVETSNNEEEGENLKSESGNINIDTVNHIKDLTKTQNGDDQITTTVSTLTELTTNVPNYKRGQSQPGSRPYFNLRRTTAVPFTTSTLTTTLKENKVSLPTTPRTSSFRKSAYGSRDLLLNRNKVKIDNKSGNKENSVIDFEIKTQYDDNENQLINRKRFRNSVSSDKATENSFEGESDTKGTSDNTDYKTRLRSRGQSRFTLQTVGTTASPRPRIRIAPGESDDDYEDSTEYIRKYRPDISYEIADLSSLTAVDLKDTSGGRRNGFGRRRLPTTQSVPTTLLATTTTTSTKPDASSKTGARTIPLARKFLENTSFGKGRRLRPGTTAASVTNENTTNSESQIAIKRFRLKRPFNRNEVQNNVTTHILNDTVTETSPVRYSPKIPIYRKLTISTERNESNTNKSEAGASQNISSGRKSVVTRRRKILKRPRTSTQRSVTESITFPTTEKPTSTLAIVTENTTSQIYNTTDTSPGDEYLNINIITKTDLLNWNESQSTPEIFGITTPFLSTNNYADDVSTTDRNEDDQNSINVSDRINATNETLKDDTDSKSIEDDDEEEGENIKLSESIVRESSQLGDFQNGNVIRGFGKSGNVKSYKSDLNNEKVDIIRFSKRPVTEPNIIIRTRKIIRKLNSTEAPTVSDDGNKKRRKIIRRLRPTTSPLNQIENNQDKIQANANINSEYLSKRRVSFNRQSPSTTETVNNDHSSQDLNDDVNSSTSKSLFSKRRYGSFNRKRPSEQPKSKIAGLNTEKTAINKSIYNRARSTTATTALTPTTVSTTTDLPTISEETTDIYSFNRNETTEPISSSETFITDEVTTSSIHNVDVSEEANYRSTSFEITESTTEFLSTDSSESLFGTEDSKTNENYNQDSKEIQTNSIKEDKFTTDLIKSTTQFPYSTIEEGSSTMAPTLNDSLLSTTESEITMLTDITEDDNIDVLSVIDSTIIIPSTTSTAKPTTSSTESALSKLLKRRRFGFSSTTKSHDQDVEFDEKDRISSLSSKFRLRVNAKLTTEKPTTNKYNSSSTPDVNSHSKLNYSTSISEKPVSTTVNSIEPTDSQVVNTVPEEVNFPTVTSTNNESEMTSDLGTQTDIPETTFLPEEFVSSSFIENYTMYDITHEQSTETLNSQIDDSTESTIEYVAKNPGSSVESMVVNSTDETTTNDFKEIFTSDFDAITKTFSTDTTQESTENDTDSTTDVTNLSTSTTSTSRKPNRLFRPINSRPKYTVRYKPSESTSIAPSTSDSSSKSYSRYKFRSRNRNKFTFSSTTEKYDENEELGYGPVKEFKSVLRVNSNIQEKNEYYDFKNIEGEEDEEEYEDPEPNDEGDNKDDLSSAYIKSSIYDRPYPYKPLNPILQRPSTFTKPEDDEKPYDVLLPDEEENVEDNIHSALHDDNNEGHNQNKPVGSIYGVISPVTRVSNAPIDLLTQKSTTKSYKGFRTSTPSPVAQNLSDINIAAINERNRNLFNKTRKVNSPLAAIETSNQSKKANTVHNIPYIQPNPYESDRSSTYNTPYNQSNLYSSTESSSTLSVPLTQDTLLPTDNTLAVDNEASNSSDTENTLDSVETGTEAYVSPLAVTDNQTNEETTESKSTPITEKSSTLLHIFAETEASIAETTIKDNYTNIPIASNRTKVEKLIEINRVIEVYSKEEFKNRTGVVGSKTFKLKTEPIIDKIGSVSRITEIKVVEDKNATVNNTNTNTTTPNQDSLSTNNREDKKYESQNKNDYNFNIPVVTSSDISQINQIHIDSGSTVNKITPKPFDKLETSTIPLEGLFQTESSLKYHHNIKSDNEILQGEHSRFVNVRILEQDIADPSAKWNPDAKYIPIKILRNEEEITMKADVVEVTPENKHQTIKIAPIKVSLETNIEHH